VLYYRGLALLILPLWLGIFAVMGLYKRENLLGGTQEYSKVFNATTLGMASIMAIGFLAPDFVFARGLLLLAWWFAFIFMALGRFFLRRFVYFLRQHGYFLSTAVIVGANEESRVLAEQLLLWKTSGLVILGFVDKEAPADTPLYHDLKCLGALEELPHILQRLGAEELILTTSALTRDEMVWIFKQYGISRQVTLRLSSGLFEVITTGLEVSELASVPLVRVNKARLTGLDHLLKFMLDIVITVPGLILLSPVLLAIAIAIKLDSPGPAIYRRRVMGVNGRQFDAYKFRSMHMNGDEILSRHPELRAELADKHKLVEDPRITRMGRFLRKTSLDELPQLFNVLKREMSLVGPRMITPAEITKYNQWDMNLLTVQPGITGLWQVSGRSDVSYEERVRLDMHYIRNWSIWLDLHLLFATIPAVLKGRGAY
jgi:exopolysaccharide biosynthesis polyprenyl glycosylphosphotransferase